MSETSARRIDNEIVWRSYDVGQSELCSALGIVTPSPSDVDIELLSSEHGVRITVKTARVLPS